MTDPNADAFTVNLDAFRRAIAEFSGLRLSSEEDTDDDSRPTG
jgi:hypothetical protein